MIFAERIIGSVENDKTIFSCTFGDFEELFGTFNFDAMDSDEREEEGEGEF